MRCAGAAAIVPAVALPSAPTVTRTATATHAVTATPTPRVGALTPPATPSFIYILYHRAARNPRTCTMLNCGAADAPGA